LVSTVPAVGTTLIGALAGAALLSGAGAWKKVAGLTVAGLVCLGVGWGWSASFPIIKNLWTSSFVLFAAGWSLLLLALFYTVIDVLGWKRWSYFFAVIGANAITIYMLPRFIDFRFTAEALLEGTAGLVGDFAPVLMAFGVLLLKWLFLDLLYRNRIYLRV
jgi:predicted acyltransferase